MNETQTRVLTEELSPGLWRGTLNSVQDRNALSGEMREAIRQALRDAKAAGGKVMIFRGSPEVFSSGYRLDPGALRTPTTTKDRDRLIETTKFWREYREQPVVTIAEVRGHCIAGGTDMMLASDISLAATDASISVPNVRDLGITMLLPMWSTLVGPHRAKLLAMSGDAVTGEEAAKWGLIAAALPEQILAERVAALAQRIALVPEELLEITKQALNAAWDAAGFGAAIVRAAELDALAHTTSPVNAFWQQVEADQGSLRNVLSARADRFGQDRVLDLLKDATIA